MALDRLREEIFNCCLSKRMALLKEMKIRASLPDS